jgi:choline dehydrogenase
MTDRTFDYVIIGAGTAGCLLANRLSADPAVSVALLEAGGEDDYFWISIPIGYLFTMGNARTDWRFRIEPDEGLNGRSIGYARGKVLGGCSSINGTVYMRGQKSDYDNWAALGNRGWSWEEVLPFFMRGEDYASGADELHGAGGELRVENARVRWEILDAWQQAAAQCGIPTIAEFSRGDNFGCEYFQVNQRRGVRWSASKAFLRPARRRPNLRVFTRAHAHRLLIEGGNGGKRIAGVEARLGDAGLQRITARRELVLAAGSIGSPQLLQLSGIGPAPLLQDQAIAVAHELAGVGANLQDHLRVRMVYKVRNVVTMNQRANSWLGRASIGLEYALFRSGPLTMPPSTLGAFAKSDPAQPSPNIEWHVQPLSLDRFGEPLHVFPAATPPVCNLRPTSRGWVRIKSGDPEAHPQIRLNYLSTGADRRVVADGMRFTRRIMAAQALAKYQPEERKPGAGAQSDEQLLAAAGDLGTTIFHPVGTCRIGSDALAVVDERLRVRGLRGLRMVDASVLPLITFGNTNAPTTMIAEKGAEMILQDARRAASP